MNRAGVSAPALLFRRGMAKEWVKLRLFASGREEESG